MRRFLLHGSVFAVLTLLTQVGGLAYLGALGVCARVKRGSRWQRASAALGLAIALYAFLTFVVVSGAAPLFGRVQIPCAMSTAVSCALNRNYVRPALLATVLRLDQAMRARFPESGITVLDANFPFLDGFPLIPHLSHDDGSKIDLAFFYRDTATGQPIPAGSPSPIGYFHFQQPRSGDPLPCAGRFSPLRWDFNWLQPERPAWILDEERTRAMIQWWLAQPEVTRIFIEPYLAQRLDLDHDKLRFQGCFAARHDDHMHVEIR